MKKVLKKALRFLKKNWVGITAGGSLLVSALTAYFTLELQKNQYELQRNQFDLQRQERTPTMVISNDGDLAFSVDKPGQVQYVIIDLPTAISSSTIILKKEWMRYSKAALEASVEKFFKDKAPTFEENDELKIPVVLTYDIVNDGRVRLLREDHFFVFIGTRIENKISMVYSSHILNSRLTVPLGSNEEYVKGDLRAEGKLVRDYIDRRFSQTVDYLTSQGFIHSR